MVKEKGYLLGSDAIRLIKETVNAHLDRLGNVPNRPNVPPDIPQAPETYVAYTSGIPAMHIPAGTGSGTGSATGPSDIPGSDDCTIFQIATNPETGNLSLVRVVGYSKTVYNVYSTAIAAGWVIVTRDKYGRWLALAPPAGGAAAFSGARIFNDSSRSVASPSPVAITFSDKDFDTGGYWNSANPTRLTIPTTGYYHVGAQLKYVMATGGGSPADLTTLIQSNLATQLALNHFRWASVVTGVNNTIFLTGPNRLVAGDFVTVTLQLSAGSAAVLGGSQATILWVTKIG